MSRRAHLRSLRTVLPSSRITIRDINRSRTQRGTKSNSSGITVNNTQMATVPTISNITGSGMIRILNQPCSMVVGRQRMTRTCGDTFSVIERRRTGVIKGDSADHAACWTCSMLDAWLPTVSSYARLGVFLASDVRSCYECTIYGHLSTIPNATLLRTH